MTFSDPGNLPLFVFVVSLLSKTPPFVTVPDTAAIFVL